MEQPPDDLVTRWGSPGNWDWERERLQSQPPPSTRRRVARALTAVPRRAGRRAMELGDRFLDRGLDSSGDSLQPEHHKGRVHYVPSAWHVLPRALRYLGVSEQDTFVDFGCGKGRIVHQAARRPFRRVIGVEVSPALAEIARRGLAARHHQHRCGDVEIVVSDAVDFPIPDDLTVAYLFDPFGPDTFDVVLRGIVDSMDRNPRRVRLIYVRPSLASHVLATGRFRLLREQRGGLRHNPRQRAALFEGW